MNQGSSDSPSLVPQIPSGNSGERGSSGAPKVSASELTQLQTLLGGLRAPGTGGTDAQGAERPVAVELGDIVAGGQVVETAKNNAVTDRLLNHMPPEDKSSSDTKQALEDTVRSPHYRQLFLQAANTFGHALSTGQMAPVLERFGISEDAAHAAATGSRLIFLLQFFIEFGAKFDGDTTLKSF
ncbi:unnamed protein product [Cylicostephanus goldi]|uniref:DEUBAD domain-containing protein n=1 Tax=Cylicostephanus goldi TaxID=71465 RepID=A0A3P6SU82_CYLGO|nr:unnamed protein product [Cylicostephanus goldi]